MATLLLGAGLVLAFEGLVLALAPRRLEEALQFLLSIPPETRRMLGLAALAGGVLLIWLARGMGA
ncbi:MAG: DUF2065 family protein [Rhodobacteraceae bacterium]|nr:DUF2065 family protein [Paracoccaceae bacterium]